VHKNALSEGKRAYTQKLYQKSVNEPAQCRLLVMLDTKRNLGRLFIVGFSVTFVGVSLGSILLHFTTGIKIYATACLPLAFGTSLVPFAVLYGYDIVTKWKPDVVTFVNVSPEYLSSWYDDQIHNARSLWPMIVVGLLSILFAICGFTLGGAFVGIPKHAYLVLLTLVVLGGAAAGIGLQQLYRFSRLIRQLGQFRIIVEIHRFGVVSTGRIMLKCHLMAVVIWTIFLSSGFAVTKLYTILIYTALPAISIILISFCFCQIPIHNQMIEYKRCKIREVTALRFNLLEMGIENLRTDQRELWAFYNSRLVEINALPEWPFNQKAFLGLLSSGLISLLTVVLTKIIGK